MVMSYTSPVNGHRETYIVKTKAPPSRSKILVSVWDVLLEALNRRVEHACLRRDAFLERVISAELPLLEKEISTPNSVEARECIAKHLKLLPSKPLTLHLAPPTIKRLDEICRQKKIVRDAFV